MSREQGRDGTDGRQEIERQAVRSMTGRTRIAQGNGRFGRRIAKGTATAALCLALATGTALPPAPAMAQDLFAPRLYVNNQVISEYEFQQRVLFLTVLRAPGNPEEEALKALIDDRLRLTEAKRLGLRLTEEEIIGGMTEFAGRANLTAEQFVEELQKVGISVETFRDFVAAGLLWRQAVRARFLGKVPITEAEVDRALEAATQKKALKVKVSELVIPLQPGREAEALDLANRLSEEIDSEAEFAAAARRHSAAPTAGRGGRLDWIPLANLPAAIGVEVLALDPGDVSAPVQVPNAVVLFQLNDVAEDETAEPLSVSVEWADFLVPNDPDQIAAIIAGSDNCMDLYGFAKGLPDDRLTVTTQPMAEVPGDVGLELAKLDPGEVSTALTRSGLRRLVMLCGREVAVEPPPARDAMREAVINEKLAGMAEGYLEELRSAALIREP